MTVGEKIKSIRKLKKFHNKNWEICLEFLKQ